MPTDKALDKTKGTGKTVNELFKNDTFFRWAEIVSEFQFEPPGACKIGEGGNKSAEESNMKLSDSSVLSVKTNNFYGKSANASAKKFDVCPQPALSGAKVKRRSGSVLSLPRFASSPAGILRSAIAKRISPAKAPNVVKRLSYGYAYETTKLKHVDLSSPESLGKSADDFPNDDSFRSTIFDSPTKPSLKGPTANVAARKRHTLLDDFELEDPKSDPCPAKLPLSSMKSSNQKTYMVNAQTQLNQKCLTSTVAQSSASNTSYGNGPSVPSNSVKRFRQDYSTSLHQEEDKENDVLFPNDSNMIGFKNFGNTCYINASMQELLGLDMLVCELLPLRSLCIGKWSKLFIAVCNLMELKTSPGFRKSQIDATLKELCDEVSASYPQFKPGFMHDSMEFLTVLIERMKGEIAENMGKDIRSNPFFDNFYFNILTVTECPNCSSPQMETTEKCTLQVTVADPKHNATSTQDLVNCAFQPKEVNSFTCKACENQVQKIYQTSVQISKLPRILIIEASRSIWEEKKNLKSQKSLQIKDSISLKNFISSTAVLPSPQHSNSLLKRPVGICNSGVSSDEAKIHSRIEYSPSDFINRNTISQDGSGEPRKQNKETALHLSPTEYNIPETQVLENSVPHSEKVTEHVINKTILPSETSFDYQLIGIVSHLGSSPTGGHYVSDVYNMSKKCWSHCDDHNITSATEDEVMSRCASNGCIFFYSFQ